MIKKGCYYFFFLFLLTSINACQKEVNYGERDYASLGNAAHELLSASPYPSLVVQISYMPGYAPGNTPVNNLLVFLNTYLNKPAGIQVIQQQIPASGKNNLTLQEIIKIEKANRSVFTGGDIISVHFLITDGEYNNAATFATSYWNTSSCIFGKTISDNSGGAGQVTRNQFMSTLLKHEFGHLLGLVDQGSPMQANHKDAGNGAHCVNRNCLMYYGIETVSTNPASSNPLLDQDCINDLKANGGK